MTSMVLAHGALPPDAAPARRGQCHGIASLADPHQALTAGIEPLARAAIGHHPKWDEVNLAATLPGLSRAPQAEAWHLQHRAHAAGEPPAKRSTGGAAALPASQMQREALFGQFIEWKRAKGH
jgi:hypothetical protein